MAEVTEADRAKAREIALPHFGMVCCTSTAKALYEEAWDNIARALAAAREQATPPKGHVLTDDGTVLRVLEWSVNPLTERIHAEIDAAESARATP